MARGFVKKRGDTWYAYWRDQRGKQRAKAISPRKKDAEAYLVEVQKEVNENTYRDIKKITFSDFAAKWLQDYASVQVKPSTYTNYACVINSSLVPFFGDRCLQTLTASDVQSYVAHRTQEGKSPVTVKKNLILLKLMLKWAVEWNFLKQNPATRIKPPRTTDKEMDFLTPREIVRFLDAVDPYWKPFFHTAIFTGMRLGELLGLKWCDIDLDDATIRVCRSMWHGKLQDPKTKTSFRAIGMSPSLVATLRDYKAEAPKNESGLVFCNRDGSTPSIEHLRKGVFNPALDRAELRRIRIHDLRHTYASLLISQGENLKYVQQQMGHSSITTTVDRYGHLMPDVRKNASEKLDATVFQAA